MTSLSSQFPHSTTPPDYANFAPVNFQLVLSVSALGFSLLREPRIEVNGITQQQQPCRIRFSAASPPAFLNFFLPRFVRTTPREAGRKKRRPFDLEEGEVRIHIDEPLELRRTLRIMMKPAVKLLLLLFCTLLTYSEGKSDGKPFTEKDLEKVRMDGKGFEKMKTIHVNWYVHSMKALIAQLSRNLLPKLSDETKEEFLECLTHIHDKKDLVQSSKCVMQAREKYEVEKKWKPARKIGKSKPKPLTTTEKSVKLNVQKLESRKKGTPKTTQNAVRKATRRPDAPKVTLWESKPHRTVEKWNSEKKQMLEKKRKVLDKARILKNAYKTVLHNQETVSENMKAWKNEKKMELLKRRADDNKNSLIIEFKRKWRGQKQRPYLEKLKKEMKRKDGVARRRRAKRSLSRLVVDSVMKSDSNGFVVRNMKSMPSLKTKESSPVERVTKLLRTLLTNRTEVDSTWADTYKALIVLKKKMDQKEKESGARVYNERMYDLVLDIPQKDDGFGMFDKGKMPSLMRNAFDLMNSIQGNSKRKGDSNIKILSPRFASLMPDKNENRGRLSPSILSFYNDESEDQILPLPKMLDATGIKGKDRDGIMELVMEVSGVKGIVHEAMTMLKSTELPELDNAINDNAKKSAQMVQDIQRSYNRKQKKEMKSNGFTLLDPKQLEKLMTDLGIAGRDDIFNLKEYALLTMGQRKEMVWDMIRNIAYGITGMKANSTLRVKRQSSVWGPHILQPTVLSPILFTPIYGLNVLGPTVLSPGLFTPLILNPAVLSPYVFSPTVGIPFILSPYLLSPYVFSPLIMAPFILNPYVLAPNVFNPYVLSPLILSPLVICPDVVSPMTLGGAILSPAVLSPSVLSKSYVMANVLSPTFLS